MTDYRDTKSHKLVPTHCAACGRALTDATSIEAGVGPVCRKKYNYEDAPVVGPDTAAMVKSAIEDLGETAEKVAKALENGDSRRAANVLVHHIACNQKERSSLNAAYALNKMGFEKLSNRVASRIVDITVNHEGDKLVVDTPYDPKFVQKIQAISSRSWDSDRKVNVFARKDKVALWEAMKECYSGLRGYSQSNGPFEIE